MSATEIGPNGLERRGAEGPAGAPGRRVAHQVATIPIPRPSVEYATGPLLVSDPALAAAAASNAAAFAAIYRRYGDGLHAFCVGMLRDPDAAADCVHDVFVIAAARLAQLRERDKLRSWLYAIARHEALRRLRARRREEPSDTLPDTPEPGDGLEHDLAARERAELVRAACAGLSDRERAVFELHYRQGLDGPALAEALGVTPTNANTMVGRMRTTVERSLGALLVARHQAQRCPELAVVLRDSNWHGALTPLTRKRIARHIEHCPSCTRARGELVNPRALLASAPVAIPAPDWLRDKILTDTAPLVESSAPAAAAGGAGGALGVGVAAGRSWWPAGLGANTSTVVAVLAPVAAVVVAVPLVLIALADPDPSSAPADAVAAAPALGAPGQPTTPSRGRFSLEPSTTRYARPAEPSTLAPRSALPPSSVPTTLGGSAGPAPGPGGVVPTSRAQRKNGFGVPYRNQDPPTRETPPPVETKDDDEGPTPPAITPSEDG